MTSNTLPYPGLARAWLSFIRPKTWGVAIAPVIASLALVYIENLSFSLSVAIPTLTLALLMQIITNMENDLGYTERKAEKSNRKGLPRATSNGWISIAQAKFAIRATMVLSLLNTLLLVYVGEWGFLLIGVSSIIAAYCYMGGPYPIAYTPYGEITVLIFFGLTAVCGTYYLQVMYISTNAVLLGCALGATAASVLAVNNWRDRIHDASIQRKTLAVVLQDTNFKCVFYVMMFLPFLMTIIISYQLGSFFTLLPLLLLYLLPKLFKDFAVLEGFELNEVMFECVKIGLFYSLLFTVGVCLQFIL